MDDFFQDLKEPLGSAPAPAAPTKTPEPIAAPASEPKSIRNVNINATPARARPRMDEGLPPKPPAPPAADQMGLPEMPRKHHRLWLWGGVIVAIIILAFAVLFAFRTTQVSVTPRSELLKIATDTPMVALPAADGVTALTYSVEKISSSAEASLKAAGSEHVDTKASGMITVLNNYSASQIRFVKDTRFQTPDGLIFRANDAVVIPAKSAKGPGSVAVAVHADQSGANYNIGPVQKFTVPGLTGSKEFDQVYAHSDAAMSGGFSGDRPKVADADLRSKRTELRSTIEKDLNKKIADVKDHVLLSDLVQIAYSEEITAGSGSNVTVKETGEATAPAFPKEAFATALASLSGISTQNSEVTLTNESGLNAKTTVENAGHILGSDPLSFSVSGSANLIWSVDIDAIKKALMAQPKDNFKTIIATFPSIEKATSRVMPFWKGTFPDDPAKIEVSVGGPSTD